MKFILHKKTDQKTTFWSGGSTTELFIFPDTSSYIKRDFDFRISTAKIEINESDFTSLPDYKRILMILDGQIEIQHKNEYSKILKQFEIDEFSGKWETNSIGLATDFNVIFKPHFTGKVNQLLLLKNDKYESKINNSILFYGIYVLKGTLLVNEEVILQNQDFLAIKNCQEGGIISITPKENSSFIVVEIVGTVLE